jgi:hypothetical protein
MGGTSNAQDNATTLRASIIKFLLPRLHCATLSRLVVTDWKETHSSKSGPFHPTPALKRIPEQGE